MLDVTLVGTNPRKSRKDNDNKVSAQVPPNFDRVRNFYDSHLPPSPKSPVLAVAVVSVFDAS